MAIDKDKLIADIDAKAESAYGNYSDNSIATHRARLIEAYLGLNTNPAPPGRSQVVDRSVYETIQTLLPSLVRIYSGSSDQVCKFMPVGPEDEAAAEQTTAYINHVATQKNQWEQFVADWIHDALLLGNGYAMAYWDEGGTVERETYEGLTEEQLAVMVQDGAKVVEHDQRPDPERDQENAKQYQALIQQYQLIAAQAQQQGQPVPPQPEPPPPAFLHDVVVERNNTGGKVRLCVLPPEHCLVGEDTPDWTLEKCDYFEFRQEKTIADLREMGLDVPEDISDDLSADNNPEDAARDRFGEDNGIGTEDGTGIMRKVLSRTIWIRSDADGKESRLYYVIAVGRTVLHAEPVSRIHAVSMTPQPLPHRHPGMSIAESVLDIQEVKTVIKRGGLDNIYFTNNQRFALSDKVNLDDFLDSRPGGLVRLHDGALPAEGHIFPLASQFSADKIFAQLEYLDQERQNRAGVSRYFSGTDAGAINKTASGTMALQNMAAQRVEHIARMFAPAFERLFNITHELVSKHQNRADVIKLHGKWVDVDPTAWHTRRDVRVSVGVGAGNKDAMLAWLNMQLQKQMALIPTGIVTPENIYNTAIEEAKLQGHANPDKFWTNPANKPPSPPQPPPEVVKAQMEIQADMQKQQAQMQADQQKAQMDAQLAAQKQQQDMQLAREKAEQDALLEKYKADLQAQTQLQIEQMRLGGQIEIKQAELQTSKEIKGAEIQSSREMAQFEAANKPEDDGKELLAQVAKAIEQLAKPKELVRDQTGRAIGVRSVG